MSRFLVLSALAAVATAQVTPPLYAVPNSQAEDCQPIPFLKPSDLNKAPQPGQPTFMVSPEGKKFDKSEYPK